MPTYIKIFLASVLSKFLIFFIGKYHTKKVNNLFFDLDLSEGIDLRLFLNFLEEKKLYKFLKKLLRPNKQYNMIDVGANIGSVSLSMQIFLKLNVLAFEPLCF